MTHSHQADGLIGPARTTPPSDGLSHADASIADLAPAPLSYDQGSDSISPEEGFQRGISQLSVLKNVDRGEETTSFYLPEYHSDALPGVDVRYNVPACRYCQFVASVDLPQIDKVELIVFSSRDAIEPIASFDMYEASAFIHRDGRRYTVAVANVAPGTFYAFRVTGLDSQGHSVRVVEDLFAKGSAAGFDVPTPDRSRAIIAIPPKSEVIDSTGVLLERSLITPLAEVVPLERTSSYRLNVKTFTENLRGDEVAPEFQGSAGTVNALREPNAIQLLKLLNVNCIHIEKLQLPVHNNSVSNPFALNGDVFVERDTESRLAELRDVISALHAAGIKVFCEVEIPHTDGSAHTRNGELHSSRACVRSTNEVTAFAKELTDWFIRIGFDGVVIKNAASLGSTNNGTFAPFNAPALKVISETASKYGATVVVEPQGAARDSIDSFEDRFQDRLVEMRRTTGEAFVSFLTGRKHYPDNSGLPTVLALAARAVPSSRSIHEVVFPDNRGVSGSLAASYRAALAHAILSPGAHMLLQGNEFGFSPASLSGPALDWNLDDEKREFFEYAQWLMQLKATLTTLQFGTFELPGTQNEPMVEYMRADGELFSSLPEFAKNFRRGEGVFARNTEAFLGTLYSKHPDGLAGFQRSPGSVPAPVLVVRRASRTALFQLPFVAGWEWDRVFDSRHEGVDAFSVVSVPPLYGRKPLELLEGSGVAVYQLRRALGWAS